eukprot:gene13574-18216_t
MSSEKSFVSPANINAYLSSSDENHLFPENNQALVICQQILNVALQGYTLANDLKKELKKFKILDDDTTYEEFMNKTEVIELLKRYIASGLPNVLNHSTENKTGTNYGLGIVTEFDLYHNCRGDAQLNQCINKRENNCVVSNEIFTLLQKNRGYQRKFITRTLQSTILCFDLIATPDPTAILLKKRKHVVPPEEPKNQKQVVEEVTNQLHQVGHNNASKTSEFDRPFGRQSSFGQDDIYAKEKELESTENPAFDIFKKKAKKNNAELLPDLADESTEIFDAFDSLSSLIPEFSTTGCFIIYDATRKQIKYVSDEALNNVINGCIQEGSIDPFKIFGEEDLNGISETIGKRENLTEDHSSKPIQNDDEIIIENEYNSDD